MKTLFEIGKNAKITRLTSWLFGCLFITILFQSCLSTVYVPERRTTVVRREVVPPPWAPQYDNVDQVHYYYLPDIEVYYDVWNHEYVYLHDGNWIYTASYPTYYSSYDINSAYVVVLDAKVNEPWRHHEQYVSHYPRYYYRSVYDNDGRHRDYNQRDNGREERGSYNGNVRGFNENAKTPIYRNAPPSNNNANRRYTNPNQNNSSVNTNNQTTQPRRRSSDTGREGVNNNSTPNQSSGKTNETPVRRGNENASTPVRRTDNSQPNTNVRTESKPNNEVKTERSNNNVQNKNTEAPQRTQPVVYPGKEVGQPVRVKRDMQPAKERQKPKEEKKEVKKDDSKTRKDATTDGGQRRR